MTGKEQWEEDEHRDKEFRRKMKVLYNWAVRNGNFDQHNIVRPMDEHERERI